MVYATNKQVVENREIVKVVISIDELLYTARQNIALEAIISTNYLTTKEFLWTN